MKLSARNMIPARVTSITRGEATAVIKASDVILAVPD
jgi:molybdopterin-binding protein